MTNLTKTRILTVWNLHHPWVSQFKLCSMSDVARSFNCSVTFFSLLGTFLKYPVHCFPGEENFPVGEYGDPSMVAILREIGLRGVQDVEPEDLLESAHQIQDALETVCVCVCVCVFVHPCIWRKCILKAHHNNAVRQKLRMTETSVAVFQFRCCLRHFSIDKFRVFTAKLEF